MAASNNSTDGPVLAVPSGLADVGIPTGVQIVGPPSTTTLSSVSAIAVEQLKPWAHLVPSL
ncbi:hypothetical protein [Arthrobacter crystallopoietes]|uniref:hypothetical protein n=1 Tax=Crystallibacter crystallopoietes TaxID=37928 RepID=UPI001ABE6B93|nr:hypothetical protein [Arthrobacter crystallopoietes]QTG82589.1 hypothetical protein J5251_08715 [Arthrobacter crystallopoietes]